MTDTPTPEQDLVAALGALTNPPKEGKVAAGARRYTYLLLGDLLAAIRPVFAEHRLAVMQPLTNTEHGISVTTRIIHASGAVFESPPFEVPCGRDAQAIGSASSYAKRYCLSAFVGLAGDDDDGQAAQPQQEADARRVEPLTRPVVRTQPKAPEPDPWQTPASPPPRPRPMQPSEWPDATSPSHANRASDKSIKMMWVLQKKTSMTPEEFRQWVAATLSIDVQWHTADLTQAQVSAVIRRLQEADAPAEEPPPDSP